MRQTVVAARTPSLRPYIQLTRPANLFTAAADVVAGGLIAGAALLPLPTLMFASVCLYASGVVLNDAFDAGIDARERPERPIPRGAVGRAAAAWFGIVLLIVGVASAASVSRVSGVVALLIGAFSLAYNAGGKHTAFGPTLMGGCRGANLVLGMSAAGVLLPDFLLPAAISALYIAAVTVLSRDEVRGNSRQAVYAGSAGLGAAAFVTLLVASTGPHISALFFWLLSVAWTAPALVVLWRRHRAVDVRHAVKTGVLGLVALNATLTCVYAGPLPALLVLSFFPAACIAARRFAVT